MQFLRKALCCLLCAILFTSCTTKTFTQTIALETDTYISSSDLTNHATLDQVFISKNAATEERTILRLPTGSQDSNPDTYLNGLINENPLNILLLVFYLPLVIMDELLNCSAQTLSSSNLTSAKLVMDVLTEEESDLTGKIDLRLLSKPWWQDVTWDNAHYFSSSGRWAAAGGDTDSSFTAVIGTPSGSTVEFDVTEYFRLLIDKLNQVAHYGMILSPAGSSLGRVEFASTQYETSTQRPRIVATYTGSCLNRRLSDTSTFYLGK